jgi:hypothetical protein
MNWAHIGFYAYLALLFLVVLGTYVVSARQDQVAADDHAQRQGPYRMPDNLVSIVEAKPLAPFQTYTVVGGEASAACPKCDATGLWHARLGYWLHCVTRGNLCTGYRPGFWARFFGAKHCDDRREHFHVMCSQCKGTWLMSTKDA